MPYANTDIDHEASKHHMKSPFQIGKIREEGEEYGGYKIPDMRRVPIYEQYYSVWHFRHFTRFTI
jgi:hypothetical protein